jgi:FlaG protein
MPDSHASRVHPVTSVRGPLPVSGDQPAAARIPARDPGAGARGDVAATTGGQLHGAYAQFLVDPDTQDVVVKIRDASTDEILSEIPSTEIQALNKHLKEYTELLARRRAAQQAQAAAVQTD